MKNPISKVWRNTSFSLSNIIGNIFKGGIISVIIILVMCGFLAENPKERAINIDREVEKILANNWKADAMGNYYLDETIDLKPFSDDFPETKVLDIVNRHIDTYNYRVQARKNNRKAGFYQKKDNFVEIKLKMKLFEGPNKGGTIIPKIRIYSENRT